MIAFFLAVALLPGCDPKWDISEDYDGDGFSVADGDCDDLDPDFGPGATDVWYDGVDSNCDGADDYDQDGDGVAAAGIDGSDGDDCDDLDPDVFPGAEDAPYDGVFSDCDEAGEYDADGDGVDSADYGGPNGGPLDCDDTDASIYPGAADEWYDGVDSDCAGDDDYDQDGDGAPSPLEGGPSGLADCDDTDPDVYPGADEVWYDGADQDCDGNDADQDGDGYDWDGTKGGLDCDDDPLTGADINPDATDAWYDGVDSDCDGASDFDQDGDGYDSADHKGSKGDDLDCDDLDASINPGQFEDCGTLFDDNCDEDTNDVNAIGCDTWFSDGDGDGYGGAISRCYCEATGDYTFAASEDCDDTDPAISPDAQEVCDPADFDEDCDGVADDADTSTAAAGKSVFYADVDGDGFGDASAPGLQCDAGGDYPITDVSLADCDDTRADVNPDGVETCDEADEDCDDSVDEEAIDAPTWFVDADEDGFGLDTDTLVTCDQPDGYGASPGDCDDTEGGTFPGADEVCDDADNDCDEDIDEPGAIDGTAYYVDGDEDGFGAEGDAGELYCEDPGAGFSLTADDCNDGSGGINPGAAEICDLPDIDQDCDGFADDDDPEGAGGKSTYYTDADGDGYGDDADPGADYCDPDPSLVTAAGDCNDDALTGADINPDATEICDELDVDEDCDGFSDDDDPEGADGAGTWFVDADEDGFGEEGSAPLSFCDDPGGYAALAIDCDDSDAAINPAATEVCDAADVDEDCDGFADDDDPEGADDEVIRYADLDGDGFGDEGDPGTGYCDPPADRVADNTDCNDDIFVGADINPDATEVCDGSDVDEDCDGFADDDDPEGASGKTVAFLDADGDGFGSEDDPGAGYCDPPADRVADNTDCDDDALTGADINPDANEVCDEFDVDEDCNGVSDDDDADVVAITTDNWYTDGDGDGFGDLATLTAACEDPDGDGTTWVGIAGDCDDSDININPAEAEVCDALDVDEDCDGDADDDDLDGADGQVSWYADLDEDGYGDLTDPGTLRCDGAAGEVTDNTDCNDGSVNLNPGATEICDPVDIDQDCDGFADDDDPEGASGKVVVYADADEDSYGDSDDPGTGYCDPPAATAEVSGDCDDSDAAVNPGATEVCDAADTDEDCDGDADDADPEGADGSTDWYTDTDEDGYGVGAAESFCDPPTTAYAPLDGDCDDGAAGVNPGEAEVCDALDVDEDCDEAADDDDPEGADGKQTWYDDVDGDDYGDPASPGVTTCETPALSATDNTDCDDNDATANPGADEIYANGTDEDCDGYDPVGLSSLSAGELILSELMVDPLAVSDSAGEWFELYNTTSEDVDLRTLVIADADTDSFTIDDGLVIPAGDYLVFGADGDTLTNGGVAVDYVYAGMNLANGGDELALDASGVILDELTWTSADELPPGGQALTTDASGDECGAIDAYGDGDFGTPGEANPDCLLHDEVIQPILDAICIVCHDAVSPSGSLDMETDGYDALVGVVDSGTGLNFVEPFLPDESYVWHKLQGTQGEVGGGGSQMPLGSAPLDASDLETIETWIIQGALN